MSKTGLVLAGLAASAFAAGCAGGGSAGESRQGAETGRAPADPPTPIFTEITETAGLRNTEPPWPDGGYHLPEIMQGGVALLDHDDDGDLDILHARIPSPVDPTGPAPNRLYRQEPGGVFVDATAEAGIADPGYGQGVAVGDVDNDGDPDVYFTNYGPDAFYRNDGDGTFTEATSSAGFSGSHWSVSAAFCDYDGDGHLDLYVTHYLRYDPETQCQDAASRRDYCGPRSFYGETDTLYRNDGDGTFTDVTETAGVVPPKGGRRAKGLGVICTDLTNDGLPDFYVANDQESNHLWVNAGDGTFTEEAILRGVAVNQHGMPEASMGLAVGDINGDGTLDLYMTHLAQEHNTLFLGGGTSLFADGTQESGLAAFDRPFTGFGCAALDFDSDGDLDIAVANGKVARGDRHAGARVSDFWKYFAEPNLLLENRGDGTFSDASALSGSFASTVEVSRGLAAGDLDGDGDLDLVLSNVDNTIRVYRNDAPRDGRHWLMVRAMEGSRDSPGAQITVTAGERRMIGVVLPGVSYAGSNDPRAHFGLAAVDTVDGIEVLWPDGTREAFRVEGVDREVTLRKGEGAPVPRTAAGRGSGE